MPRIARIVVPGLPHHVTQRGNNRQRVFFTDADRRAYLRLLREQCQKHGVRVLAYCLMDTHVHLIVVPRAADSLALAIGRTHWLYAQHLNRTRRRSGHLWQNRFFSCAMDSDHLLHAACYTERNPVEARLVRRAWSYAWSSAAAHIGQRDPSGVLDLRAWSRWFTAPEWKRIIQRPEDEHLVRRLERCLRTGRPLAGDRALNRLEATLGRRLRALAVGRPRRTRNADRR